MYRPAFADWHQDRWSGPTPWCCIVGAQLGGVETQPDEWHGSLLTLDSDWAHFTEADRDATEQRLTRLARTISLRLDAAGPTNGTDRGGDSWALRAIAEHLTGIVWYAEQVGDLSPV